MASIEIHTLANTIALPYTAEAAAPLYVPSNIGKTRAAELLAVRVLAWLIKHENLAVTRNSELVAIDRVRGYAEAFVTERNWAPSRRPSVRTLDAGAVAAVFAYLGADDAERAEVLDALHTVPSAGGDDGYSVSMALADPSGTLANHLENVRDAVADALANIAKGRDACGASWDLARLAESLATWRPAFLAGADGVDVDAETKDQNRLRLALAGLALALGVDASAHGAYAGGSAIWRTDGAALYDAITEAITAHAEGRGTGKGACSACERPGTVIDGRCANCERKGASVAASGTEGAAVVVRGETEYTDGVCRGCGAEAEGDTDHCSACHRGQHVSTLFWRMFNCNTEGARAEAKAELIALGEYSETDDAEAEAPVADFCGCEAEGCSHDGQTVPAGDAEAAYIGRVCDACAGSCMADYLVRPLVSVVPDADGVAVVKCSACGTLGATTPADADALATEHASGHTAACTVSLYADALIVTAVPDDVFGLARVHCSACGRVAEGDGWATYTLAAVNEVAARHAIDKHAEAPVRVVQETSEAEAERVHAEAEARPVVTITTAEVKGDGFRTTCSYCHQTGGVQPDLDGALARARAHREVNHRHDDTVRHVIGYVDGTFADGAAARALVNNAGKTWTGTRAEYVGGTDADGYAIGLGDAPAYVGDAVQLYPAITGDAEAYTVVHIHADGVRELDGGELADAEGAEGRRRYRVVARATAEGVARAERLYADAVRAATPVIVTVSPDTDDDGTQRGQCHRVACTECIDVARVYPYRWHAVDAATEHAAGSAHTGRTVRVIDPAFPDTEISVAHVISSAGHVFTFDTGTHGAQTDYAVRVPVYADGFGYLRDNVTATSVYETAAAAALDATPARRDDDDTEARRRPAAMARVLGVQAVTVQEYDDGAEARAVRRVVACEIDAAEAWPLALTGTDRVGAAHAEATALGGRAYEVRFYRGHLHYLLGTIVCDADDMPVSAHHTPGGTGAGVPIDMPAGTDGATAIRYVVGTERRTWRQDIVQDRADTEACTDCAMAIANGDEPTDMNDDDLAEWRARFEHAHIGVESMSLGHFHTETVGCWHAGRDCDDDCDCERTDYSRTPCGVCGNRDAGTRDAVVLWLI